MKAKQPEALQLARVLEIFSSTQQNHHNAAGQAAAELRRLHSVNAELLAFIQDFANDFAATSEFDVRTYVDGARELIALATQYRRERASARKKPALITGKAGAEA